MKSWWPIVRLFDLHINIRVMNLKARMRLFEDDAAVLGEMARQFDENSKEHQALKHASIALWYVMLEGHDQFKAYVLNLERVTAEQKAHFSEMGAG
jgi:hypothetical protein